jgi:hypothetical protein
MLEAKFGSNEATFSELSSNAVHLLKVTSEAWNLRRAV